MIDASFSRQRAHEDRVEARGRRRLIIPLVAALVLIGGVTAWALGGSKVDAPPPTATSGQASDEIAVVTEKLDALQQSVASIPAPSVAAPISQPKARH